MFLKNVRYMHGYSITTDHQKKMKKFSYHNNEGCYKPFTEGFFGLNPHVPHLSLWILVFETRLLNGIWNDLNLSRYGYFLDLNVDNTSIGSAAAWYRMWRCIFPSWFRHVTSPVDGALLINVVDFWWCVAGRVIVLQCDWLGTFRQWKPITVEKGNNTLAYWANQMSSAKQNFNLLPQDGF